MVLAVIALAVFLFEQHRQSRLSEINQQLTQNAARVGGELELKFKNYQQLVNNVTRVLSATSSDASVVQSKLDKEAEQSAQRTREQRKLAGSAKRNPKNAEGVRKLTKVKGEAREGRREVERETSWGRLFLALRGWRARRAAQRDPRTGTDAELKVNELSGALAPDGGRRPSEVEGSVARWDSPPSQRSSRPARCVRRQTSQMEAKVMRQEQTGRRREAEVAVAPRKTHARVGKRSTRRWFWNARASGAARELGAEGKAGERP